MDEITDEFSNDNDVRNYEDNEDDDGEINEEQWIALNFYVILNGPRTGGIKFATSFTAVFRPSKVHLLDGTDRKCTF